jgi:glycosyltransferase involved in cell wall biosynthesis
MRFFPRRDHPARRLVRACLRRLAAGLGSARPRGSGGPLLVLVSGEPRTPGHAYRVDRCAREAAALGWRTEIVDIDDLAPRHWSAAADRPKVVLVWRVAWRPMLERAVAAWRAAGARILYDIDDLMVDPTVADPTVIDAIRSLRLEPAAVARHYAGIRRGLLLADACLAPTEPLAAAQRLCGRPAAVLPNGFDEATYRASRAAVSRRGQAAADGLVRLGYAAGTRTHQRDFSVAAPAVAGILHGHPECRLVLFRDPRGRPLLDPEEFPLLRGLEDRIEWRPQVPLERLPEELARFDVNLAPLEVGNPFCEAKSELKYFEAALVDVPTVASPTRPFREAILAGRTGFLAATTAEWHDHLTRLVADEGLRRRIGRAALWHVLHRFGPDGRRARLEELLGRPVTDRPEATRLIGADPPVEPVLPEVPETEIVARFGGGEPADVAVVVPLHDYERYIGAALDSVAAQTLPRLELVVVDDASRDGSLAAAADWLGRHAARFTAATLLRQTTNQGLPLTRNAAFAAAEAALVFPLDADNVLTPDCLRLLHARLGESTAAAAHPTLRHFGDARRRRPARPWSPERLARGNYIDAMALIRKSAWALVGGYSRGRFVGWEDYELWCKFVEHGLWSVAVPEAEAGYRVHAGSMLQATTRPAMAAVVAAIRAAHPWLAVRAA